MHFKYATILNTIYVTFMYGYALPMLFPIAAFTFLNIYIAERYLITYFYQKPPVYDEKLNSAAIGTLKWAPLTMMLFGQWIMSNKQIFNNTVEPKEYANGPTVTDHSGSIAVDQSLPLFIMACILFVGTFFNDTFLKCFKRCGCASEEEEDDVDEKLGTYFECVSSRDRKRWLTEEVYNFRKLGIKTMSNETQELIRTTHGKRKLLKNAPNYEILANIKYISAFQFTPIDTRDTEEEQIVSDLVTRILFMGYTQERFKNFSFKSQGNFRRKTKISRNTTKSD